jgi:hypothetical protein
MRAYQRSLFEGTLTLASRFQIGRAIRVIDEAPFLCGEASALCCLKEESRFAMFGIDVLGGEKSEADG